MTKAEFLAKLTNALGDIPAADCDAALAFFTEQLDDRIEEGMTEAEAVESLGSFNDIIAALREEINTPNTPTTPPLPNSAKEDRGESNRPGPRSFTTDKRPHTIELTEANCAVEILPSPNDSIRIDYDVTRWINVTVSCDADRLVYTTKEIFHIFHFDFVGRKPTRLYLPKDYLPNLEIKTGNAKLSAADISCAKANLKTSNAALHLCRMTANDIIVKTSNGALTAEHITAGSAQLTTSNGSLKVAHCTAGRLDLKTTNGSIRTEHCTANAIHATTSNGKNAAEHITADTIELTSSNGRIDLQNSTATHIALRTSNATIAATLPGSIADYRITSSGGSNSKSTIPTHKATGDKSLSAVTSNGKIDVIFAGDR